MVIIRWVLEKLLRRKAAEREEYKIMYHKGNYIAYGRRCGGVVWWRIGTARNEYSAQWEIVGWTEAPRAAGLWRSGATRDENRDYERVKKMPRE